jgi:hypothetical protein
MSVEYPTQLQTDCRDPQHHPFGVAGASDLRSSDFQPIRVEDVVTVTDASIGGGKTVADLKLGPLPNQATARIAIDASEGLKEERDADAAEHSRRQNRPGKTPELIVFIMQEFFRADHGWPSHRKQTEQVQTRRGRASLNCQPPLKP